MQDYSALGVTSMEDRKRNFLRLLACTLQILIASWILIASKLNYAGLFQLIQTLKSDGIDSPPANPKSVPAISSLKDNVGRTAKNDLGSSDAFQSMESISMLPMDLPAGTRGATPASDRISKNLAFALESNIEEVLTPRKRSNTFSGSPALRTLRGPLIDAYGIPFNGHNSQHSLATKSTKKMGLSDRIRVCVRKRPLSKKELKRNEVDTADVSGRRYITISEPKYVSFFWRFVS